jgi:YHS domain-containing protein
MKSAIFFIGLLLSLGAFAQQDFATRKKHFNLDDKGLAVQGYDVVSYFEGKATKGNSAIYLFHKGVKYLFVSQSHLEQFKANPEKYEPNYGGWCAYAMGKTGEKVEIDPTKYKIVDGKLNLYYYSFINNTLDKWNEDEQHLQSSADQNWSLTIKK